MILKLSYFLPCAKCLYSTVPTILLALTIPKILSGSLQISPHAALAGQILVADVSICYMRMEDGRVFDLQRLCGRAPADRSRSPFSSNTPTTPRIPRESLPEEEDEIERVDEEFTEESQSPSIAVPQPTRPPVTRPEPRGFPTNTSPAPTPVQPPGIAPPVPAATPLEVAPPTPELGTGYFQPDSDEVP